MGHPKASSKKKPGKPSKPNPTFPLTAHANGQWCKKIRGKVYFFGVWADPAAALDKYLRVAHDLHAGRKPRSTNISPDALTVKDVCNLGQSLAAFGPVNEAGLAREGEAGLS